MSLVTYRSKGVSVQRHKREDSLQQLRNVVTISSDQSRTLRVSVTDGGGGEVGVSKDNLVSMTHAGQGVQQLRGQDGGDTLQNHL